MKIIILTCIASCFLFSSEETEERFTDIYHNKIWGSSEHEEDFSGGGSIPENLKDYIQYMSSLISENNITSILDVGCGSFWSFSTMDLNNISYTGIEIVEDIVVRNNLKYGTENIDFLHGNAVDIDLPKAELVVCKHVLQHLTNKDVFKLLDKFKHYKYCVLMNQLTGPHPINADPIDKAIDLLAPPFNLKAEQVKTYNIQGGPHQLILIVNNKK